MRQNLLPIMAVLAFLLPARLCAFYYEYEGVTLRYEVINEDSKTCKAFGNEDISGDLVIPGIANDGSSDYIVTEVGNGAFKGCKDMSSVTIPNSVTSIGVFAFYGCIGLTSVEIPNSVTEIGQEAFSGCSGLTSLVIPDSVTSIGNNAFRYCSGLTRVVIPNSVTSIGNGAFHSCSGLTCVDIPNTVTSIGNVTFYRCSGLTSVEIPNSVTSIGVSAFNGCSGLTSLVIPDSVTSIDGAAFAGCSGLTSVVIGSSVTEIGSSAFYGCHDLISIECKSEIPISDIDNNTFSEQMYEKVTLYVPKGCIDVYRKSDVWGEFLNITDDEPVRLSAFTYKYEGVTLRYEVINEDAKICRVIGYEDFSGDLVIPDIANDGSFDYSVTEVGNEVFRGCKHMTSVEIPNSVTSIGNASFWGCLGLTSVVIPNSVTQIGLSAFGDCSGLTSVELSNSVISIGNAAFRYCSGLTSVEIPNSVTSIGVSAFHGCSGLTTVVIPNSVISIGNKAFCNCVRLTKVEFSSIESLCNISFEDSEANPLYYAHHLYINGKEVTEVVIPDSVTSIGNYAFRNCSGLTSVVIPNSVTEINSYAFYGCENLDTLVMGYGIKEIRYEAFKYCPASKIYITAQIPPAIQSNTFDNYKGMLYLQGQAAVNAYNDDELWGIFNNELMTEPTAIDIEGPTLISGHAGDTFQLKAKMTPEDVSLPYVFWSSTNPEIATVDMNGLVTLHVDSDKMLTHAQGEEDTTELCAIIAETLYYDGPIAKVSIDNSGVSIVDSIPFGVESNGLIDYTLPYDVYNISGLKVADSTEGLAKGIYFIRQGKVAVKTMLR